MRVSYQHANPSRGNESVLVRFHEERGQGQTNCVLVDAGDGVNVGDLLGEDEYLDAICLTHAHLDHYGSLVENHRHSASIYASPDTAAMLETVLGEGTRNYDVGDPDAALDNLLGIDDWRKVTANVAVRPVPAGHAPGAAGFLIRFEDGASTHHALATGDFTRRRAGGYPGFTTDLPDVGAVFLTGATNDRFEREFTASVGKIVARAREGSSVLVAASGLTGVQYAYLLGHLGERIDDPVAVTLVGQAAKLAADLGYDVPNVECVPAFEDPTELLAPGTVTIAGPEVPRERSAGRLFGVIEDDPGATLVQVTGGATTPVDSAGCTVADYVVSNHPTDDTVDEVVEALSPFQIVVIHTSGSNANRYKEEYGDSGFVWITNKERRERVLYENGDWVSPDWIEEGSRRDRQIRMRHRQSSDRQSETEGSFPALDRADDADLAAEGLDLEDVRERLYLPDEPETTTEGTAERDAGADPASETARTTGADTAETPSADEPVAVDGATTQAAGEPTLSTVLSRLDDIEAAVSGERVQARVIDAGDDVTLLRLPDGVDLPHGREVEIALSIDPALVDGRNGVSEGESREDVTGDRDD
jgi:putative mRNA 3-end processing factor